MTRVMVQQHEDCEKCTIAVRSQPGRAVELFDKCSGRRLLLLKVTSAEGCWLADALRRAFDHAREPEAEDEMSATREGE